MQAQQLRQWVFASLAVALLIIIAISLIDSQKIYNNLQSQLAGSGIQLEADALNLSLMYTGSIQLDNVHIQAKTFDVNAKRLFIDLDLPALLTGKAVPQALYLQSSNINIIQEQQDAWLSLLKINHFKLKRIDISQSEIHFDQQHITLEKVDLDIRDIGANKNPRMELRAHLGDGRIDAYGYLHLKRGVITKGFSSAKLFDIPLSTWQHKTSLETFSGSITSHINEDASWQSFGHLTLQQDHINALDLRAKIVGNKDTFLSIDEMVFNHQGIGGLQVSGQCLKQNQCKFEIDSKGITATPLLKLLKIEDKADVTIQDLHFQTTLSGGQWFTSGKIAWPAFDYIPIRNGKILKPAHIFPARLQLSNFMWTNKNVWRLNGVSILASEHTLPDVEIQNITYDQGILELPIHFHQTDFWLPLAQGLASGQFELEGRGTLDGSIQLTFNHHTLTHASANLNASQAEIRSDEIIKPLNVPLQVQGQLLWQAEKLPALTELSVALATSTVKLRHENFRWFFSDMEINFDEFNELGVQLPKLWQQWHGYIRGETTLHIPNKNILIEQADVDLIQFGNDRHFVDGQIQTNNQQWQVQNLHWTQGKNSAEFFSRTGTRFDIVAESLDTPALAMLHTLPFFTHGRLKSQELRLPFGTLNKMTSTYKTDELGLHLSSFQGNFYEGSLSSQQVDIAKHDETFTLKGTIQVGGIHLNNWLWLHKQFGTHLEATIYATLNLQADFNTEEALLNWEGDGDVAVYNGVWLFHDSNITADKVTLTLRKRKEFNTTFKIKDGKKRGSGRLRIDEHTQVSGSLKWQVDVYEFSKSWPNFKYNKASQTTQ